MAPEAYEKKGEKSYLTSAVDSINPWAGKRASSPAPDAKATQSPQPATATAPVDPGDHSITHLYGQSFRTYPPDCPPLYVQWYHAIDVCTEPGTVGVAAHWYFDTDTTTGAKAETTMGERCPD